MKVRRFDIFAIYNFVKNVESGMDVAQAKGEAIWLAKVVASGGRRRNKKDGESKPRKTENNTSIWKCLGGQPQTDATFDHDIIERLGEGLYNQVLERVHAAFYENMDYKTIRDCPHGRGWCEKCATGRLKKSA